MNIDGRGESSVSEDSECRNKNFQEINYASSLGLDVNPFQRLECHFSSLHNCSVSVDKKRKCPSSHENSHVAIDFQDENSHFAIDFQDENSYNKDIAAAKLFLEKEECSKETACHFYSLIQSVSKHVSYIKEQNDENIEKVKKSKFDLMDFSQKALDVCDKIKNILTLSYTEKVWDHLTESQKEDVEKFQKLFSEFYEQLNADCVLYEDIKVPVTSAASSNPSKTASCISMKSKQHQELLTEKNKLLTELKTVKEKYAKLQETSTEIDVASSHCQNQARLIAILSPFLYVHRLSGQSVAEISSYFRSLGYHINEQEIENILISFPSLFRECESSEGHTEEKRWIFCGYDL